jgi:hypothetical protein
MAREFNIGFCCTNSLEQLSIIYENYTTQQVPTIVDVDRTLFGFLSQMTDQSVPFLLNYLFFRLDI